MRLLGTLLFGLCLSACGGKVVGDDTGSGTSKATGVPGDPSSSSSGGTAPSRPPSAGCRLAQPVQLDFEDGIYPANWGAAPGGLQQETASPIDGKSSLKIDVARALMYQAHLNGQVDSSCGVFMKLSIRMASPLFAEGESAIVARLVALPTFYDLVLGPQGSLSIVENPAGTAHPIGTISADVAASVQVLLDLTDNTMSGSVSPLGATPAQGPSSALAAGHGNLTAIVLGLVTTSASTTAKTGTYWLDDFSLE